MGKSVSVCRSIDNMASVAGAWHDRSVLTLELLLRCLGVTARVVEVVSNTTNGGQAEDEGSSRSRHFAFGVGNGDRQDECWSCYGFCDVAIVVRFTCQRCEGGVGGGRKGRFITGW